MAARIVLLRKLSELFVRNFLDADVERSHQFDLPQALVGPPSLFATRRAHAEASRRDQDEFLSGRSLDAPRSCVGAGLGLGLQPDRDFLGKSRSRRDGNAVGGKSGLADLDLLRNRGQR